MNRAAGLKDVAGGTFRSCVVNGTVGRGRERVFFACKCHGQCPGHHSCQAGCVVELDLPEMITWLFQ
jgi:hypothetical protein